MLHPDTSVPSAVLLRHFHRLLQNQLLYWWIPTCSLWFRLTTTLELKATAWWYLGATMRTCWTSRTTLAATSFVPHVAWRTPCGMPSRVNESRHANTTGQPAIKMCGTTIFTYFPATQMTDCMRGRKCPTPPRSALRWQPISGRLCGRCTLLAGRAAWMHHASLTIHSSRRRLTQALGE